MIHLATLPKGAEMKKLISLTVLVTLTMVGLAEAGWQQRAAFFPDRLTSHSWDTTTVTLAGCPSPSVILQKAQSPGTVVQLLYNPSATATCQNAINRYLDDLIVRSPRSGAVTFNQQ
jgi:hypothetical protein